MWNTSSGADRGSNRRAILRYFTALGMLLLGVWGGLVSAQTSTAGISGVVRDFNNNTIGSAVISIVSGPTTGRQATANSLGQYTLTGLAPGTYTFIAERTGFTSDQRTTTLTAGTTTSLNFTLAQDVGTGGTLQGTVTRRDRGLPLSGAQVTLSSGGLNPQTISTAADGTYRFTGLATGSYRVTVSSTGFIDASRSGITVRSGRTTTSNFQLTTRSGQVGTLKGRVTNGSGTGVGGVQVLLQGGSSTGLTATTNSSGYYTVSSIVPDTYTVQYSVKTFPTHTESDVAITAGRTTTLNVALGQSQPGNSTISGTVVDSNGDPISSATVSVLSGPTTGVQATTDGTGAYTLSNLAAGTFTLIARRTGYTSAQRTVTVAAGGAAQQDFTLAISTTTGGTLQGTVTRLDRGLAISGAQVTLTGAGITRTVTTGSDGTYTFSGLDTGTYSLAVTAAGFASGVRSGVSVRDGQTTTSNFQLTTRQTDVGTLQGRVTDVNGAGVGGVQVLLQNGSSAGLTATTNSSGFYTLSAIVPDVYAVQFSGSGFATRTLTGNTITAGGTTTLNVTLGAAGVSGGVSGTVLDPLGNPVNGARVEITSGPVTGLFDVTGADGAYQFTNLPNGTYAVRVRATGFFVNSANVTIADGQGAAQDFTLVADANSSFGGITGNVTGGSAASGTTVRITGGQLVGTTATADAGGNYTFLDLPAGTYELTFSTSGQTNVVKSGIVVTAGSTVVVNAAFAGGAGGTLTGTVQDQDGNALSGVKVTVKQGTTQVATATTDSAGQFTLSNLSTGTYSATFTLSGYAPATVSSLSITAGGTKVLSVQLSATGSGTDLGTLQVTVKDALGRVVPSATVRLENGSITLDKQTDATGKVQFTDLAAGSYSITVTSNGAIPFTQSNIQVTAGNTTNVTVNLQQQAGSSGISGVVRNRSGLPLEGATVTITSGAFTGSSVTTGADGKFLFIGLPSGSYALQASAPGYASVKQAYFVRSGANSVRDFYLPRS